MQAIKYTLKYLYKGSDQVTVTIEGNAEDADTYNEIEQFQNKQYVSADWCQHQNEVADRKPAENRLQLHLPEEQTVYFDSNKKDESIEEIEKAAQTKLTSFFELNCQDEFAQTLLYQQIPKHYTWNTRQGSGREE